ncbi:hypothetical protein F0562_020311 [Nyssa sinensis]|uniref:Pentacotripeptide-repeat region of PRORP domain-containing protein n=1 Tax=Nyssa sinensis TaxID=561372 RepID=A0A5J5BUT2_9ASTE|nr:hypothetical protein F0562_020311 [Nyssa sinensis]
MEMSYLFGNGLQPILTRPSPITSTFTPPPILPSTVRPSKNSQPISATATFFSEPTNVSHKYQKPLSISYTARQSAILDIQESSDLDSALARSGGMLKVQDLNIILRHFGKLNRWQELSQLFDWMQKHGKINISSYSSYIKFLGNSLRSGKFESSIKLFHQMKQGGLKPDVVTYSTLLAGCNKVKLGYSKALELVEELKYNGLHMDSVIYGTFLAVCASNNQM